MRLAYLQLKNYRRFRDLELEFPDGLVGVIGLNGAGKSSLLEAVAWVLYGNEKAIVRTGRESVKRQDSAHSDPCEVVLEFELNRTMYRIQRSMVGKALTMTATLLADGKIMATGTKETTEAVVKLLGMDYKAFFISVFAQQKELNALTTLQPAARRKEVLRMLGIQDIDDAVKMVREDRRFAEAGIKDARKRLYDDDGQEKIGILRKDIDGLMKEEKALRKTEKEKEKQLAKQEKEQIEVKKKIKGMEEKAKARNAALREKASLSATLKSLKNKKEELTKELDGSEEIEKEFKKQKGAMKKVREELDGLSGKRDASLKERDESKAGIGELKAGIKRIDKDIAEIDENINEIEGVGSESECPTCQRKLGSTYEKLLKSFGSQKKKLADSKGEAKKKLEGLEEKMTALAARMKALDKRGDILNEKVLKFDRLSTKMERLAGLRKKLEATSTGLKEGEIKLKEIEEKLKKLKYDEGSYDKSKAEADKLEKGIRATEKEASQAREKTGRLEVRISAAEKEIKGLEKLEKEFKAKTEEFNLLDRLAEILAGFRTHMISRIRPGLSQSSSRIMSLLTESRYNEILLNEDYEISMLDEGDMHPIDRFSGGEKDLANLCLRLAISQIITERAGTSGMNFIILDEIFGSQDINRRSNIFSALAGLSNRFKQIFLITHVEEVKDMVGNAIVVKSLDDGTSTAEVV